jgi:hypothetical protein
MEDIKNMNVDEIEDLQQIIELKDKAKRLYKAIASNQYVDLFSEKKIIWKDDYNSEYLIQKDGQWVWVAAYLNQHYEVTIDENYIFQMLKSAYYFEKEHKNSCLVNHAKDAMRYFEGYVNCRIKKA